MLHRNHKPQEVHRKFGTPWAELQYVCKKVHYLLYERKSKALARRYLARLERVLGEVPENDLAILRQEGLALLSELKDERRKAIQHRQREIKLTERLHDSVRKSVKAGDYDVRMGASILAGHDDTALDQRRAVLRALQEQTSSVRAHK